MTQPFRRLRLERPLAVLDTETTGLDPGADRIVELAVARFDPGVPEPRTLRRLVDPGVPIPPAATAVHGIADADVADAPPFARVARRLLRLLDGCDLAGFNLARFDLPFLAAELARAGLELSLEGRSVVDVMQLFHRQRPRDLAAAVRYYLAREHDAAHSALGDALATAAVLDAQAGRRGAPRTVAGLHRELVEVDVAGKLARAEGRVVLAFGKYRGEPLRAVARRDPGYLRWLLGQAGLLADARARIERALERAARDA